MLLAASMIALLSAAAAPAAAQDEEQPRWFGDRFDNMTILAYGIPDSDYVALSFGCELGAHAVKVGVQDEQSNAEEGKLLAAHLTAGGKQIAFSGKAVRNQDSGGIELYAYLPLGAALRHVLVSNGPLEVTIAGRTQRYAMAGAVQPAAKLLASCDGSKPAKPANDLEVTVTNKAKRPLQSFAYSEAGVNAFDGDSFGAEPLAPGASRTFVIPKGRSICTFDISVIFADDDEECCSMGEPAGTQNLCGNSTFIVHD